MRIRKSLHSRRGRILLICGVVLGVTFGYLLLDIASRGFQHKVSLNSDDSPTFRSPIASKVETVEFPDEDCLGFFRSSTLFSGNQNHFSLIDSLGDEPLMELLDRCKKSQWNTTVNVVQRLLLAKFAQRNPTAALDLVWSFPGHRWNDLLSIVFGEWSAIDIEAALHAIQDLGEPHRSMMLRHTFETQVLLSDKAIETLAVQMGIDSFLKYELNRVNAIQQLVKPNTAWNLVIQDNIPNEEQEELLVQILEVSLQKGDLKILDRLVDDLSRSNYELFDRILASAISFDEENVAEYVLSMSPNHQNLLFPRLVRVWPKSNLHGAFEVSSRIAKSSIRKRTQSSLLQVWAEENPLELLNSIHQLPEQLHQVAVLYAVRMIAQTSPKQAAMEISRLKPLLGFIDDSTEYVLVDERAEINPTEALRWINSNAPERSEKRARMMQRVLTQYALIDPMKAMSIALSEPPHVFHGMTGLESEVIGSLTSSGQLDVALDLLKQVRESARSLSFMRIGVRLIQSDRTEEAIELAQQLSKEEQFSYFNNITSSWLSNSVQNLIENLSALPSKHIQSNVAKEILVANEQSVTFLTREQLAYVQSFLVAAPQQSTTD